MTDMTDLARKIILLSEDGHSGSMIFNQLSAQLAQMVIDAALNDKLNNAVKHNNGITYIAEIERLARQEQKEKDANLVYTYALQAGASSRAYVTFTESKHLLAIAQEIRES